MLGTYEHIHTKHDVSMCVTWRGVQMTAIPTPMTTMTHDGQSTIDNQMSKKVYS